MNNSLCKKNRAFTLLETLISVIVLSMIFVATYHAVTASFESQALSKAKLTNTQKARNVLNLIGNDLKYSTNRTANPIVIPGSKDSITYYLPNSSQTIQFKLTSVTINGYNVFRVSKSTNGGTANIVFPNTYVSSLSFEADDLTLAHPAITISVTIIDTDLSAKRLTSAERQCTLKSTISILN